MKIQTHKILLLTPFLLLIVAITWGQTPKASVTLTNSNLPIVFIKTDGGVLIPNEPSVGATMKIINNGYNANNNVNDTINGYNGQIKIETRGSWTLQFPQKSYSITTIDAQGVDLNDTILGMKKEHKWVLYAPYDDYYQMLNPLTFKLTREMGRWAPRTRYCEVIIDTGFGYKYNGVYVMMEKIKRDENRVDITKIDMTATSGDALTGGYIIAIDKNINGGDVGFTTKKSPSLFIKYVYPKDDEITPAQKTYIQNFVDTVETALKASNFADPVNGYRKYIDVNSFIDFFIIQELSKNLDGFKRSAYMYKDMNSIDGKLHAGPQWDFNAAYGNSGNTEGTLGVCDYEKPEGWVYLKEDCWIHVFLASSPVPFYWKRLMQDPEFTHQLNCRWTQLRQSTLSKPHIYGLIDSIQTYIQPAAQREITHFNLNYNFNDNVSELKTWISTRLDWMDANMPSSCPDVGIDEEENFSSMFSIYPNPVTDKINLNADLKQSEKLKITLTDAWGRIVTSIANQDYSVGYHNLTIPTNTLVTGIYYLNIQSATSSSVQKVVLAKD